MRVWLVVGMALIGLGMIWAGLSIPQLVGSGEIICVWGDYGHTYRIFLAGETLDWHQVAVADWVVLYGKGKEIELRSVLEWIAGDQRVTAPHLVGPKLWLEYRDAATGFVRSLELGEAYYLVVRDDIKGVP